MYKRALVPLDGSPVAETIPPFILEIAGSLDMEVVLLRVVQPVPSKVPVFLMRATEAQVARRAAWEAVP